MKKKLVSLLLAGIMTLSLAACGNTNAESQQNSSTPSSAEQSSAESTGGGQMRKVTYPRQLIPLREWISCFM